MKKNTALCISTLLGALAVLSVHAQNDDADRPAPRRAASPTQKWEHLGLQRDASKPFSDPEFAKKINELGTDGWELVTVLNFTKEGTTSKTVYYFKRQLQ